MSDLDQIKAIEQILKIELRRLDNMELGSRGYTVNLNGAVTGVGLFICRVVDLTRIIKQLAGLAQLTDLYLSNNQLTDVTPLAGLTQVTTLHLGSNQLTDVTPLASLTQLTSLYLPNTQLTDVTPLAGLTRVTTLDVSRNQLTDVTPLAGLTQVTTLDLRDNRLTDVTPLAGLTQVTMLWLAGNQLTDVTPLAGLTQVTMLWLAYNQLTDVTPLAGLTQVRVLWLESNQLTDVTPLAGLTQLTMLNLWDNNIATLPEAWLERDLEIVWKLGYVKGAINLYNNPLTTPPPEIVKRGKKAIRKYFQQLKAAQAYLYEAKLLIVGEPGAGKTTFAQKIRNQAYKLQPNEISTKGIDLQAWDFPLTQEPNEPTQPVGVLEKMKGWFGLSRPTFRVNIWDFGGQEIYKATHQFFLTKRSLYVLVADSRKEDTDFYYWLNIVSMLSDNSPIIILKNEKQDRVRELPERQLRAEFTNLKDVLPANLATNRGLDAVLDTVRHYLTHLPHVGSVLPKTWVNVRNALEQDDRNYIAVEEYYRICEQQQFTRRDDQLQLSGYLHDLGVCLHFQDDDLLKKTVILKPEWGTAAVYKVLDNPVVIRNLGCFTKEELKTIWHENEYADMRGELLQLMMKFQLCYEIPGRAGRYIAPQLLSEDPPEYQWETHPSVFDAKPSVRGELVEPRHPSTSSGRVEAALRQAQGERMSSSNREGEILDLQVRYAYEFMPKGMLTRFIVATHPLIEDQTLVWKSGVVLKKEGARAEIIEYYGKREIHIRVSGAHKKELLTVVMYKFEKIHGVYSRLKYDTLIPCNCLACKGNAEPHFYTYQVLRKFQADRQPIQCQKSYEMVNVQGLLDEVIDNKLSDTFKVSDSDDEDMTMGNIVKELSEFLTPLPCFANEASRRAVLINAGLSDLLSSVKHLNGSAFEFVASLLDNFEQEDRKEELIKLLQEVHTMVGGEKKNAITRFIAILNTPNTQNNTQDDVRPATPTHVPQMNVYGGNVHIHHGDEHMETKQQFNNQIQNLNGDLIQGSQNFTTGAKTYNLQTPQDLTALLAELQKMIAQSPLPDDAKEELAADLNTAQIQAKKSQPEKMKLTTALDNAKSVLTKIGETAPQAVAIGHLLGKAIDFVSKLM